MTKFTKVDMEHLHHDIIANILQIDLLLVPLMTYVPFAKNMNMIARIKKKKFTLFNIGREERTLNKVSKETSFLPLACIHLIHGVKRSSYIGCFFQLS